MQFLNNMSEEEFLNEYWEKKPCVIRNAVDNAESLVNKLDLVTMACDEDYETRMISKSDEWEVNTGPFNKDIFTQKNQLWTLIVHNMNFYFEKIKELEKRVEFIPKWLFDDVMCTYSTKGSSVGAHIDNYNVFILQTSGQRKWSVQLEPDHSYQEGIDVKILQNFCADEEFILNPGDMIYIPPHVAHWGESLSESISLSIGFKSIEDKELLDLYCLGIIHQEGVTNSFFNTGFKKSQRDNPFELTQQTIDSLYEDLKKNLDQKELFEDFIIKNMSTPKNIFEENEIPFSEFEELLSQMNLYKDEYTRGVYRLHKQVYHYGVNSLSFSCDKKQSLLFEEILNQDYRVPVSQEACRELTAMLFELYKQGSFYFSEE